MVGWLLLMSVGAAVLIFAGLLELAWWQEQREDRMPQVQPAPAPRKPLRSLADFEPSHSDITALHNSRRKITGESPE